MSAEDLEQLDVEAVAELPAARSMLATLKALLIELLAMVTGLRADLATRDALLAAREAEIKDLKGALLGQRSERGRTRAPRAPKAPVDKEAALARKAEGQKKRKSNRSAKDKLPTQDVPHPAPVQCPACECAGPFSALPPEVSIEIEHVPERFVRRRHVRHKCLCGCGHIFTGLPPERVGDCAHYGPGLHAHAVVSKCADAMPLNRLATRFGREGVVIARSTLTDMFHRSAALLEAIYLRLVAVVAASPYVNADETSQPVMDTRKCRRGFIWTFIAPAEHIIVYVFSASRSGETPVRVLGDSNGRLQVDGYTGYNDVTTPDRRERDGCLAHARRYFVKAIDSSPTEAQAAIVFFRQLYEVEYRAAAQNILGTPAHLALRIAQSKPVADAFKAWLDTEKPKHLPKGPLGAAIRYATNQWTCLTKFLTDPKIRLDNNISEGALRIIALGRDTFHWVGHDDAGKNLAILQSIVATCIASGVNPKTYLTDVLMRVQHHPASGIDELLPGNWKPPP